MTGGSDRSDATDGWDALRAADPAAGVDAPTEAMWATIHAQIGADRSADVPPPAPAAVASSVGDDPAAGSAVIGAEGALVADRRRSEAGLSRLDQGRARRSGRSRIMLAAAAVVALVAVAGASFGAGALFKSNELSGVSDAASGASQDLAPSEQATARLESGAGAMPDATRAAGDPDAGGQPGRGGGDTDNLPIIFAAGQLGDGPSSAMAYTFDAASQYSAQRMAAVAAVFGLRGTPVDDGDQISIGDVLSTAEPSATLASDSEARFSFKDPAKDVADCSRVAEEGSCAPRDTGPAPSGSQATSQARQLLAKLQPNEEYEYHSTTVTPTNGESNATQVTARRMRDGVQIGDAWSFTFTGLGCSLAEGPLAPIIDQGRYALISPQEAVRRLGDPAFAAHPLGSYDSSINANQESINGLSGDVAPLASGAAVPWPVRQVTISSATLSAGPLSLGDSGELAVPIYVLSNASGESWSVIAIADEDLAFTDPG